MELRIPACAARRRRHRLKRNVLRFVDFPGESKQFPKPLELDLMDLSHRYASLCHQDSRSSPHALATKLTRLTAGGSRRRVRNECDGDVSRALSSYRSWREDDVECVRAEYVPRLNCDR